MAPRGKAQHGGGALAAAAGGGTHGRRPPALDLKSVLKNKSPNPALLAHFFWPSHWAASKPPFSTWRCGTAPSTFPRSLLLSAMPLASASALPSSRLLAVCGPRGGVACSLSPLTSSTSCGYSSPLSLSLSLSLPPISESDNKTFSSLPPRSTYAPCHTHDRPRHYYKPHLPFVAHAFVHTPIALPPSLCLLPCLLPSSSHMRIPAAPPKRGRKRHKSCKPPAAARLCTHRTMPPVTPLSPAVRPSRTHTHTQAAPSLPVDCPLCAVALWTLWCQRAARAHPLCLRRPRRRPYQTASGSPILFAPPPCIPPPSATLGFPSLRAPP